MIIQIVSFICVLGILVFVHELGHFLIAKWCGIRVETFSLGFPPKMIGFRRGDTEYCISWVPLGGYVKMAGEKPEESDVRGEPYEFMSKTVWQRASVILAGPAMNYLFTIFLMFCLFWFKGEGTPVIDKALVGSVEPGFPAAKAGMQPQDLIISIDDTPIDSFPQIYGMISKNAGKSARIAWLRGSDTMRAEVVVKADSGLNLQGEIQTVGRIGIGVATEYSPVGFFESIARGFNETNGYVYQTVSGLFGFISGTISSKLIGGPVFIAQAVSRATREGIVAILLLASVISVNLCVINLIPIPVLDGGQLLFLVIEKIKGSPISMRARAIAQQVGLLFLVLLIIFVTKNDIWRINIFGW